MNFLLLDLSGDSLLVDSLDNLLLEPDTPAPTTNAKGWFWWEAERLKRDEDDVIQTIVTVLNLL